MGTVKLSGLNDYLRPSPECVLPINNRANSYEVTLKNEKKEEKTKKDPVKVTLSDCLSCSGCLTSSEPLLENNFYLEVIKKLFGSKFPVISLSTQSILSLCSFYDLTYTKMLLKIKKFFNAKGIKYVFNQSLAEAIHLEETKKEFDEAYKNNTTLICSNCPGWVIYAEKSLDKSFLSNISRLIPLQAVQGILVKYLLCLKNKIEYSKQRYRNLFSHIKYFRLEPIGPSDIYHVCVTPCHDKKLESVRPDLVADFTGLTRYLQVEDPFASSVSLVDAVITTSELKQVLDDHGYVINDKMEQSSDSDVYEQYAETNLLSGRDSRAPPVQTESGPESRSDEGRGGEAYPEGQRPGVYPEERSDEGESRDAIPRSIASAFGDEDKKSDGVYPEERGSTPKSEHPNKDSGVYPEERAGASIQSTLSTYSRVREVIPDLKTEEHLDKDDGVYPVIGGGVYPVIGGGYAYKAYESTGGCSGGYAEELVKHLCEKYSGSEDGEIEFEAVSNKDYKQAVIKSGKNVIKVSLATGYRNIANVVSSTTSRLRADYVEVMACPGGCINGGGQLKEGQVDMKYDDRVYIRSDKIEAIAELEGWMWKEVKNFVKRGKDLLRMELNSVKETRTDW